MPEEEIGEKSTDWSFTSVWNKSLEQPDAREVIPRDHLWASDLGKPMADVYLKLLGTAPTNPPNERSLRKFEAGNLWEWIMKMVLMRAGILVATQERVSYKLEGMLEVTGKIDFVAGGNPDWEHAKNDLEHLMLPEKTLKAMEDILQYLQTAYPNGLEERNFELKSCASFMMNSLEINPVPLQIHRMQAYLYTKGKQKRTDIAYICRDDCRMMEFPILADNEKCETELKAYVEKISGYYFRREMPPLDKFVDFNDDMGKFSLNRAISWSPYLTLLYKLKDQAEFDERYKSIAPRWNRVIKRAKNGDKMTAKNEEVLEEIRQAGYDVPTIISKFVMSPEEDEDVVVAE